jgi:CheY-like chemotaxis protein
MCRQLILVVEHYCILSLQRKIGVVAGDDDDFDIITVIKLRLQQHCSFDVYAFTDPCLALEHFKVNASKYQLVISDIRMPQMNGFEFIKK